MLGLLLGEVRVGVSAAVNTYSQVEVNNSMIVTCVRAKIKRKRKEKLADIVTIT